MLSINSSNMVENENSLKNKTGGDWTKHFKRLRWELDPEEIGLNESQMKRALMKSLDSETFEKFLAKFVKKEISFDKLIVIIMKEKKICEKNEVEKQKQEEKKCYKNL
ncbi:hypothetical protein PAEPH01_2449, partial [Pancytospora epiphaga]